MAPIFQVPFDCSGGLYKGTTYPTHSSFSVDFNGIDGSDIGDPVHAMLAGKVYFLFPSNGQIHVEDVNGWGWILAHCQKIRVKVGDTVALHEQVAELGNAGIGSTGPHAHVNHTRHRVPIQVRFNGIPYPASVPKGTGYLSGPLMDCHGLFVPLPKPEVHMKLAKVDEAGYLATIPPTTVIEDAGQVKVPGSEVGPNPYHVFGRTPGGRIAIAYGLSANPPLWQEAYVKPDGVTVTPSGVDPKALERAAALGFNEGLDTAQSVVSSIPEREVPV